jgi:hypothetical protein
MQLTGRPLSLVSGCSSQATLSGLSPTDVIDEMDTSSTCEAAFSIATMAPLSSGQKGSTNGTAMASFIAMTGLQSTGLGQ